MKPISYYMHTARRTGGMGKERKGKGKGDVSGCSKTSSFPAGLSVCILILKF
jgi:hypothetical protein